MVASVAGLAFIREREYIKGFDSPTSGTQLFETKQYPMISKSKYVKFKQCPMALWLDVNKPEVVSEDASAEQRMETGRTVGDLAKGLFGDYVDVSVRKTNFL